MKMRYEWRKVAYGQLALHDQPDGLRYGLWIGVFCVYERHSRPTRLYDLRVFVFDPRRSLAGLWTDFQPSYIR